MRIILLCLLTLSAPAFGDWGVTRDPFDKRVAARYRRILERNPHDSGALRKLSSMYSRYRSLKQLRSELERGADKNGSDAVVLGYLALKAGDSSQAQEYFQKGLAKRPKDGQLAHQIGKIHYQAGEYEKSIQALDSAYKNVKRKQKSDVLYDLVSSAKAAKSTDLAIDYQGRLIKLNPRDANLRIQLGDLYFDDKKYEQAIKAYEAAASKLRSDPSKRLEVLARVGLVHEASDQDSKALKVYYSIIEKVRRDHYLRRDLTTRIIDIYRQRGDLRPLVAQLEKQWKQRGYFEYEVLANLHEETGSLSKAVTYYRLAIKKRAYELETHRRLIRLLETMGKTQEAIKQYERLARIAPGEAQVQLDLAQRYFGVAETKKAFAILSRLKRRFSGDPAILGMVADLYLRWGQTDLALKTLLHLTKIDPGEPRHFASLGEFYFQNDKKRKALAAWKNIIKKDTAARHALLASVYGNHAMLSEARKHFEIAVQKKSENAQYRRDLALILTRLKRHSEAAAQWSEVIRLATKQDNLALEKEATSRYVRSLHYAGQLRHKMPLWSRQAFDVSSPNVDLAKRLAIAYLFTGRLEQAASVLRKIGKIAPKDIEAREMLAEVLEDQRKLDEAVAVWLEVVKLEPARKRDVYNRISDIKRDDVKDEEALRYAMLALGESKDDPAAHEKLAESYVDLQRYDKAIEAYQKVLELDPRNTRAALKMAALLQDKPQEASAIYRHVLRKETDELLLEKAARAAIVIDDLRGKLGELERVLSPLAAIYSHKPVFSEALLELYDRYVPQLHEQLDNPKLHASTIQELARIRPRATPLLLRQLRGKTVSPPQRAATLQLLEQLEISSNTLAIVEFAKTSPASNDTEALENRRKAWRLVALAGDSAAQKHLQTLYDKGDIEEKEIAAFGMARISGLRLERQLQSVLNATQAQPVGALCLGLQSKSKRLTANIKRVVDGEHYLSETRAACLHSLARTGAITQLELRQKYTQSGLSDIRVIALRSLDRSNEKNQQVLFAALLGGSPAEQGAAARALAGTPLTSPTFTILASGRLDTRAFLERASQPKSTEALAMAHFVESKPQALRSALITLSQSTSTIRSRMFSNLMNDTPLIPRDVAVSLSAKRKLEEVRNRLLEGSASEFISRFDNLETGAKAALLKGIGRAESPNKQLLLLGTTSDQPTLVKIAAYEALCGAVVASKLSFSQDVRKATNAGLSEGFRVKSRALRCVQAAPAAVRSRHLKAAITDQSPLVRLAALELLRSRSVPSQRKWVQKATSDPIADVRLTALQTLHTIAPSLGKARAKALRNDPSKRVRRLARQLSR